jgi:hypothetical protein
MSTLRPLQRGDLPQVASLFERVMRSGSPVPSPEIAPYLERTILDHPWADPEIPSLVYVDDRGRIQGFIGSHVRRMCFDGRPARMACVGHLIAAPEVRNRAVGALLLRRYIGGPQDLTVSDTGSAETRRMWAGLGGETATLASISWTRVFRPCLLAAARLLGGPRTRPISYPVRGLCSALDALIVRVAGGLFRAEPPQVSAETLTADAFLRHIPEMTRPLRLHPGYDKRYLEWLFQELPRSGYHGTLVRHVVRDGDRVLGWYLYYLQSGGISRVLQILSRDRDVAPVLDHLFHHAERNGAAALDGRVEPRLLEPLWRRRCILRYTGESLMHSREAEVIGAALSREALLTRMDGEWWSFPP